ELLGDPRSVVPDRDLNRVVRHRRGADGKAPLGHGAHRLTRVENQVEENLLKLHAITEHGRKVRRDRRAHGDATGDQFRMRELEHLADQLADIQWLEVYLTTL